VTFVLKSWLFKTPKIVILCSKWCCLCGQLLLHAVVDYIADLTVSKEDFEVVKHDLGTVYINQMLKPHKLNQSVLFILINLVTEPHNDGVTVTVTKVIILCFLVKDWKRITVICIYSANSRAVSDTTATIAVLEDLLPSERTLRTPTVSERWAATHLTVMRMPRSQHRCCDGHAVAGLLYTRCLLNTEIKVLFFFAILSNRVLVLVLVKSLQITVIH